MYQLSTIVGSVHDHYNLLASNPKFKFFLVNFFVERSVVNVAPFWEEGRLVFYRTGNEAYKLVRILDMVYIVAKLV